MYRVVFSNGFTTVVDWNGISTLSLAVAWDIIECWYPRESLVGVTIVKIVTLGNE